MLPPNEYKTPAAFYTCDPLHPQKNPDRRGPKSKMFLTWALPNISSKSVPNFYSNLCI